MRPLCIAFFLGLEPPKLDEIVFLLADHACRLLAAIPKEDVNVFLDVDVITEPLGQARRRADAVVQHSFGAVQRDFELKLHFFGGHHGR